MEPDSVKRFRQRLAEYNFDLIYKNRCNDITIVCPEGHELKRSLKSMIQKKVDENFCSTCKRGESNKANLEKIKKDVFDKNGHEVISYDPKTRIITFICANCSEEMQSDYKAVLKGTTGTCVRCMNSLRKLPYSEIVKTFKDNNLTCLFSEKDYEEKYKGNKTKIPTLCECGEKYEAVLSFVRRGSKCNNCKVSRSEQTNLEKYGKKNAFQVEEFKEKSKKTRLEKYGVEHVQQCKEIREKTQNTNLEKYGVKHIFHTKECVKKALKTMKERYGVYYPMQNSEIREKMMQSVLEKWGTPYVLQSQKFCEDVILPKYGSLYHGGSDNWKKKLMERYGVENPMHNLEFFKKAQENAFRIKEYELPNGKIIKYQGWENLTIKELLEDKNFPFVCDTVDPDSIRTEDIEPFDYKFGGKNYRYYTDIEIVGSNCFVEVKSTWTYSIDIERNLAKWRAVGSSGHNLIVVIYGSDEKRRNAWLFDETGDESVLEGDEEIGDILELMKNFTTKQIREQTEQELLSYIKDVDC
jgi:hypothetical protein